MSARERRSELLALLTEVNNHRIALAQTVAKMNEVTNLLLNEAERLLPAAIEEADAVRGKASVKAVRITASDVDEIIEPYAETVNRLLPTAKGKRACSICGTPGHRKTTCPKADIAYRAVRSGPPKKGRKPLSPERKAQLVETLKKARAARRTK